jgi:hypothetical protein
VVAAPVVSLAPASLSFGSLQVGGSSAAQSVTLTNTGTAALTIASVALTGANPGDFAQATTCPLGPLTLAAGANCSISVSFGPTAAGARSASVSIVDDAGGSPQSVSLSGTGTTAPSIAFDKNLGSKAENVASAKMTLTTGATAATNSHVFLFVNWNQTSRTLTSVTGGGLTWSIDV